MTHGWQLGPSTLTPTSRGAWTTVACMPGPGSWGTSEGVVSLGQSPSLQSCCPFPAHKIYVLWECPGQMPQEGMRPSEGPPGSRWHVAQAGALFLEMAGGCGWLQGGGGWEDSRDR